jgi:hypothetical protein
MKNPPITDELGTALSDLNLDENWESICVDSPHGGPSKSRSGDFPSGIICF